MWYFSWILGLLLACSLGILHILRFEAQETFEKEHIPLDPVTRLFTKDVMMTRLREKVENSRRNGFPFSMIAVSLEDFNRQHQLLDYESDAVLRNVVDYLKEEIREGVDIAARMNQQVLLIVLPGASLKRAEATAAQFKDYIGTQIKAPRDLSIDVAVGVATYTGDDSAGLPITQEVDALIDKACGQIHPA
jgi:cyd operon protein YbgT